MAFVLSIFQHSEQVTVFLPFTQSQFSEPFSSVATLGFSFKLFANEALHRSRDSHIAKPYCVITADLSMHTEDSHMQQIVKEYPVSKSLLQVLKGMFRVQNTSLD